MASKHRELYLETNTLLFDTYSKIVRDIQPILKEIFPGDDKETAYAFSIRAKACDLARGLLPLSTFTNMGTYANGRAYEYLILNLFNEPLSEMRFIARQLDENLKKVIPAFIKRATNERGDAYRKYLQDTESVLAIGEDMESVIPAQGPSVKLVECDDHAEERVVAAILYSRSHSDYEHARARANAMSEVEREKIFANYLSSRKNRHHKPGRALEEAYFSFDVVCDWGAYKDLQRHRVLTRHRQFFTHELGYWTPDEVVMTGFGDIYKKAMDRAAEAYSIIKRDFPYEAQYLVAHGSYTRFYMKMNLREVAHMVELRTSPQGHPTYRKVGQLMAQAVTEKYPMIGKHAYPFVDFNDYELERLDAFRRLEKKADALGVKGFED